MEFKISETNGTVSNNETLSYAVTSASGGIYNVNMSFVSTESFSAQFVVDSNNQSVISATFSGFTFYGSQAKAEFDGLMSVFGLQVYFGGVLNVLTDSTYFHSTGTQSMTFGQATFPVTTYVANSLPISVNECGYSSTITDYTLQVGTPTSTSLEFITYLHIVTTAPTAETITFQLVSMSVS